MAPGRLADRQIGQLSKQLIHVTDWYPTFVGLGAANESHAASLLEGLQLHGINAWNSIAHDAPSERDEILHNIDPISNQVAIRVGDWKLLSGMGPARWYPPANFTAHLASGHFTQMEIGINTQSFHLSC